MKILNFITETAIIEGLIETQDPKKTAHIIGRKFPQLSVDYDSETVGLGFMVRWFKNDEFDNKMSELFTLINNMGWFMSMYTTRGDEYRKHKFNGVEDFIETIKSGNIDSISMKLEMKFDPERGVQKIYYHVTQQKNIPKIAKYGLAPRTESKIGYHPERIYLAINYNYAMDILEMMYERDVSKPLWCVYEVDASKIKNLKTLVDPNFDGGVYTSQNIPPTALKLMKKFDMSKY